MLPGMIRDLCVLRAREEAQVVTQCLASAETKGGGHFSVWVAEKQQPSRSRDGGQELEGLCQL